MSASEEEAERRVFTIELFFDLVFVFTLTQLTALLAHEPDWTGLLKILVIFGNVYWIYDGYLWLTNTIPPRDKVPQLLLLLAMVGFLICALATPDAFGDTGLAFGIGYLLVTAVHSGLWLLSGDPGVRGTMRRLGPINACVAVLILIGGATDSGTQWALWVAAFVIHWITPFIVRVADFHVAPGYFVERHGLIILIALGESIIAIGIGLEGMPLTAGVYLTASLGLAVAAALWWLYFGGEDEAATAAIAAAPPDHQPRLAIATYGFTLFAALGGIIVLATGIKFAIAHYDEAASAATAWFLAGGIAAYIVGFVVFRRLLAIGPIAIRLGIAVAALATAAVGLGVTAEAQLGALVIVLFGGLSIETATRRPDATRRSSHP